MLRRVLHSPVPRSEQVTTWWHGLAAAATWSSRNVASVTENANADVTLTFQEAYQATPAVIIGAGESTDGTPFRTAITASSVRFVVRNTGAGAVAHGKCSVICVGEI